MAGRVACGVAGIVAGVVDKAGRMAGIRADKGSIVGIGHRGGAETFPPAAVMGIAGIAVMDVSGCKVALSAEGLWKLLLYYPAVIALGCLKVAVPALFRDPVGHYLEKRLNPLAVHRPVRLHRR